MHYASPVTTPTHPAATPPSSPLAAAEIGPRGLEAIFRPRSIAVIGASRDRGTVGAEIFHNLLQHGFQGPVYPVNPKADSVHSVRAYPSVDAIPGAVDLAMIVVPAARVSEVLEACGRKGVRAAVVISAGFKEIGGEGIEREKQLVEIARRYEMRVVGPNCLGVLNTEESVRLDATFAPTFPPAGAVAMSSQSGALGLAILEVAADLNIGISQFISVGNKADLSGNDLLEFWERDAATRVILLYLESFGNPRRFLTIARRVARSKPIVAVKSGRTRAGMRAASSHTGSLAGAETAVDALCTQSGVIRVETMEELFDVAMLVANQPVPSGPRVGIVTNAGGPGIMASDACETHGLEVVTLSDDTVRALREFLPAEASIRNPVDMIASASPESYEKAVRLVAADPQVDALLVLYVPPIVTRPLDVAAAIGRGNEAAKAEARAAGAAVKPVLSCFMGSHGVPEGLRSLQAGHIPSYPFPESAAIALARAVRYGRWRESPQGVVRQFEDIDRKAAAGALATATGARDGGGGTWLEPAAVRELLAAYGIAMPESAIATSADQTAEAAQRIGFPVAIKLVSDTITHKSDVGGVVLDVRDADAARGAWEAIAARLKQAGRAGEMQGVLVQPMARDGVETIVGMTRDPSFGPLLMFGLGGIQAELLKDVLFRLPPLTDRDATEMVGGIRGARLLEGYRGAPPSDRAALEELLQRVSQLVGDQPTLVEMDLNPVLVRPAGRGCLVLDARIAVSR